MNALRNFRLAFVATWRAILTDAGAITLLFVGGLVYSFFYPMPYSQESVQRVPVAVVDQDRSTLSRQVTRYASAHPSVNVVLVTPDLREAQDLLWKNEIAGTIFIPAGFNQKILSGRQAEVEIAGNGMYMMLNKAALNGLAETVGTISAGIEIKRLSSNTPSSAQALAQRQPVSINSVPLFNVREGYGAYIVPGVLVLIIQQTLLLSIALMFGTWHEGDGLPISSDVGGYSGVLAAYASTVLLNCLYFFGFVLWWQDYPRGGNFGGLLVFAVLFAFAVSAFGMMVGMLFRTRERSAQLMLCTAMPLMFLSGLSWPVEALPSMLQIVRWAVPSTAAIQGFIGLNQLGANLSEVRTETITLAVLLLVSVAIGLPRWKNLRRA